MYIVKHHLLTLLLALLLSPANGKAQEHRFSLADTLLHYGPVQTVLLHDSVNRWLMERELVVGYEQCYQEYYEQLCLAASMAWEQQPDDASELEMSRLCMAWQRGELATDSTAMRLQQLYDADTQQHGSTTFKHFNQTCLMATFYCAAGYFAKAEACYRHVKELMDAGVNVYTFQYCVLLEAFMVSQAGQGRLTDAWSTALTIVGRNNSEVRREYEAQFNGFIPYERNIKGSVELKADGYGLGVLQLSVANIDKAQRLAQQLLLPVLLPPPSAFCQSEIVPWSLCLPSVLTTPRRRSLFAVFLLQDLLFRLDFPYSFCNGVVNGAEEMGQRLFDDWGENYVVPPLAVDICRRTAMMTAMAARQDTTIHYLHDSKATTAMIRWKNCMAVEQQNNYERSALALLGFISEWIKKGYPHSMLPLAEEAVQAMRRELNVQHPTQRQLMLRAQDQRWLIHELPQWSTLVGNIPEYAPIIAALQSLTKS